MPEKKHNARPASGPLTGGATRTGRVPVSIVVIGRNEEDRIKDCLQSVVEAARPFPGAEILFVDSASEDGTVELARQFPIRILSLLPAWPLSPSAGRYVGFHHTRGETILFVDGDCTIDSEWLDRAVFYLLLEKSAAAVSGFEDERYDDGREPALLPNVTGRPDRVVELERLRGVGLYRRRALDEARPFNPFLVAGEEGELALRLRQKGYRLLHLPYPMACHWRGIRNRWIHLKRDHKLGRFQGDGLTLRYAWRAGTFWRALREEYWYLLALTLALSLAFGGLVLASLSANWWWLGGWLGVLLVIALALWRGKRSLSDFVCGFLYQLLNLFGVMSGFIRARVHPPDSYPLNAIEVKVKGAADRQIAMPDEEVPLREVVK